ncbi:MAG: hypothetical protein ACR2NX_11330 [Chthoniobacterales bacterium]
MASGSKIVDLRQLLAERFPQARRTPSAHLATGLDSIDAITEGGLAKGAITELTSPQVSAGSALLLDRLLDAALASRYFMVLIDGRDSFDPAGLGDTRLRHLLWVRCGHAQEAVQAADLLLRDGNFSLVVLDLVLNPAEELRKIPSSNWYRLQRLVEATPTAFLVLTRRSMISSAHWKLTLENNWRLSDLEQADNFSRLKFELRRGQVGRHEMAGAG